MLRYLTSGESHGPCLTAILEGLPAGLRINKESIDKELQRRQCGYGRGERMKIESDKIEILSGLRKGETLGSPLALLIRNRDWENWQAIMDPFSPSENPSQTDELTRPRPGHADLAGAIKYNHRDLRNILERSSARETAARVAVGAIAKILLKEFEIEIINQVIEIGKIKAHTADLTLEKIRRQGDKSQLSCPDRTAEKLMVEEIEKAERTDDSLGGIFEVIVTNIPIGLGSHVHWDKKLDGKLAQALMSIQAVKGVEIGLGFEAARRPGSKVHDEIFYQERRAIGERQGLYRKTNNAGGIEGGITNGELLLVRAAMKPIPTLKAPLRSVDLTTKESVEATVERADTCAVPAAAVVGEAVVAFEIAGAMQEKFGGDSLGEMKRNYQAYMDYVKTR
ncbi:chorismate synthase [candidate division NPL-UPA2 bacterium]|nr:chorismate synthase [candidate division NPL-UPA2 bacterium]